jgi:hypothetical protein
VAYEIHDGLAQVVAASYQHVQSYARQLRPRTPERRAELQQILDLSRQAVVEVRQVIAGLRRPSLMTSAWGWRSVWRWRLCAHRAGPCAIARPRPRSECQLKRKRLSTGSLRKLSRTSANMQGLRECLLGCVTHQMRSTSSYVTGERLRRRQRDSSP